LCTAKQKVALGPGLSIGQFLGFFVLRVVKVKVGQVTLETQLVKGKHQVVTINGLSVTLPAAFTSPKEVMIKSFMAD
jgi:hypothetical protein